MNKNTINYDNVIHNKDELIEQLESLKENSIDFMTQDIIFVKDVHALRIIINYLKENIKDE